MKSKLLSFLIAFPFLLWSQELKHCGSEGVNNKLLEEHPWLQQVRDDLNAYTQNYIANHYGASNKTGDTYIIPIVFHVLHNYGPENVTDDQIYEAVRIINEDYRKRNSDTSNIVPSFKDIAADCEMEFRLATIDPKGNCTNGIDRIQTSLTYSGSDDAKLNQWPRDIYLNVWLVQSIAEVGVAGYAYKPYSVNGIDGWRDGIIILYNYIGNKRALTHEIGHYFNLSHTWGNTNEPGVACGDDGIFDTPITKGWSYCNLNGSVCNPPIIENVQNYMEYSYCSNMFTEGQKLAMHAALNNEIGRRNLLWQPYALNKSGATHSQNTNSCLPVADFSANKRSACVGDPVTFNDFSWKGLITSWNWSFTNATPSTSTDENPVVAFNEPGWQKITLTVSNDQGQDTRIRESYVLVGDGQPRAFFENFENSDEVNSHWAIENYDNNESSWKITGNASYSGGQCLALNSYDVPRYDIDVFYTPLYDLSASNSTLNFKYSAATKATAPDDMKDRLRIYYSINCGSSWQLMFTRTGAQLANKGFVGNYYIPNSESSWNEMNVAIPSQALSNGSAMFKFEYTASGPYSNNFYIDNINLNETYTGLTEPSAGSFSLSIYPNPASRVFTLLINSNTNSTGTIKIFDPAGKLILAEESDFKSGLNSKTISNNLTNGMYYVVVKTEKNVLTQPIVIAN